MSASGVPYLDMNWPVATGCLPEYQCWGKCWARGMAHRFHRDFAPTFHPGTLALPLHWRKARKVGVCFTGDQFVKGITDEQLAAVFGIMAACPQHTFFVLTKRPHNMQAWLASMKPQPRKDHGIKWDARAADCWHAAEALFPALRNSAWGSEFIERAHTIEWPLRNVYLGVSVSTQADADERIPYLLRCQAAFRWVSVEPMLQAVNLSRYWLAGLTPSKRYPFPQLEEEYRTRNIDLLDWVVCAAESGPKARPLDLDWARDLRDQCAKGKVPFMLKDQRTYPPLDGIEWNQMPWSDLA